MIYQHPAASPAFDRWLLAFYLESAEAEIDLMLDDVSRSTVLDLVTEPYGATWKIRAGVLWILVDGEEPPEEER